jgi:hypothetical protein
MTEDERVKAINETSAEFLQNWLRELDEGTKTPEDLLSLTYALMVATRILGYAPDKMLVDAEAAAARLMTMVENDEELLPEVKTCKNKDENGGCPLHNLHCHYPDCENEG